MNRTTCPFVISNIYYIYYLVLSQGHISHKKVVSKEIKVCFLSLYNLRLYWMMSINQYSYSHKGKINMSIYIVYIIALHNIIEHIVFQIFRKQNKQTWQCNTYLQNKNKMQ